MWKRRDDGGSVSGGRITLLLRIKWECMREKARDIFCRRELLASAAFHGLPRLFIICSLSSWWQNFLIYSLFFLFSYFCLVLGWWKGWTHVAKRKASGWPCWHTLGTPQLQHQVRWHVLTALHACRNCSSNLQEHRVWASTRSQYRQAEGKKFALQFNKSYITKMLVHFPIVVFTLLVLSVISASFPLILLWILIASAMTGSPCTPYGPLYVVCSQSSLHYHLT